ATITTLSEVRHYPILYRFPACQGRRGNGGGGVDRNRGPAMTLAHHFRKYQKSYLAVLAILCMVIFIFQFGRGDLIDRLSRWFGWGHHGDPVATLHGE